MNGADSAAPAEFDRYTKRADAARACTLVSRNCNADAQSTICACPWSSFTSARHSMVTSASFNRVSEGRHPLENSMAKNFTFVFIVSTLGAGFVAYGCDATGDRTNSVSGSTGEGNSGMASSSGAGGAGGCLINCGNTSTGSGQNGSGGGKPGNCDVSCQQAGGTCQMGVCTIVENPGNVPQDVQTKLDGGGNGDPGFKWLYPYDKTVFPRGLLPPLLQFDGVAPEAMLVHVTFAGMDYKGYFGGSNPARVQIPDDSWKAITLAAQATDWVNVDVTKTSGGIVASAPKVAWKIAPGSIRGTIYYETYNSVLAGAVGIMKISPGSATPSVIKTGCGNVCHTASADGSTLVAATTFPFGSASYDLKNNASVMNASGSNQFVYGGIYPDGSFVVSSTNYRTWLGGPSRLYDTKTGLNIPAPSWDSVITNGGNPAFSPDGKWISFNHQDTGGGHVLAAMEFDRPTNTFSNLQDVASDPARFLGWPAFTPDSKWIVYHAGSSNVYETNSGATGDLFITNTQTHKVARLDQVNGYNANGSTYLPANDPNLSFAPTVLPVAVGGYFWTVFTSHRSYGNVFPSQKNNDVDGQLWVAAIDLNPTEGADASHPAFYLDGQEAVADNLRGFWVLDPCKADGSGCTGGDECCGGYCQQDMGGNFVCSPTSNGCSHELDKCNTAADCCDPASECINGHCAITVPK